MRPTEGEQGPEGPATGHSRGACGLLGVVAIAILTLVAAPALSVAAEPPGTIISAEAATLISAVIPAPANSTYRSFLPDGMAPPPYRHNPSNPNRPSVKLNGLDLKPVGIPFSLFENYAMVRSQYCGRNGWYNQGDGANSPLVKPLGDSLGVSKFDIDPDSSLDRDATEPHVWKSRARLDGEPLVTMTWRRDPLASRSCWKSNRGSRGGCVAPAPRSTGRFGTLTPYPVRKDSSAGSTPIALTVSIRPSGRTGSGS